MLNQTRVPAAGIAARALAIGVLLALVLALPASLRAAPETLRYDLVVAGGTPGGLTSAIAAARHGEKVLVVEPTPYIGGVVAGGLTASDVGRVATIGGLSREFFDNVLAYYVKTYGADSPQVKVSKGGTHFEPKIAAKVFTEMVAQQPGITVWKSARLKSVRKDGDRIAEVTVDDRANKRTVNVSAPYFIDATYEGDLMALAGVKYRVGREGMNQYQEPHGLGSRSRPGDADKGDHLVQAYNYRLTLTNDPANRVAVPKPANYDPEAYATLRAQLNDPSGPTKHFLPDMFNGVALPNSKIDANAGHAAAQTSDHVGGNIDYPDGDWKRREEIIADHRRHVWGLLYFLQNDPAVPEALRAEANEWGFSRDEFTDNENFSTALYVREARRMIGKYVFREKDATTDRFKEDSVGLGSYPIDMHAVERHVLPDGKLRFGGGASVHGIKPYEIPYGVLVPQDVKNLLVPVAMSATGIGYATLRMEPVFMILGHAAGVAAHLARRDKLAVQDVPVPELRKILLEEKQLMRANRMPVPSFTMDPAGTVPANQDVRFKDASIDDGTIVTRWWDFDGNGTLDSKDAEPTFRFPLTKTYRVLLKVQDNDGDWSEPVVKDVVVTGGAPSFPDMVIDNDKAELTGRWPVSASLDGYVGTNYAHDENKDKGARSVRYVFALPAAGVYDVLFSYVPSLNRADNTPVVVRHKDGEKRITINQRRAPQNPPYINLGRFSFDKEAVVQILTEGTNGNVVADAVKLIYVAPAESAPQNAPSPQANP